MNYIDLHEHCNSKGLTDRETAYLGDLTPVGTSIPNDDKITNISSEQSDMKYRLLLEDKDNFECKGQTIYFKKMLNCRFLGIIGVGIYGDCIDELFIQNNRGDTYTTLIKFTDFTDFQPFFKENSRIFFCEYLHSRETENFKIIGRPGNLWEFVIDLHSIKEISSITFPNNPCIHIFALSAG